MYRFIGKDLPTDQPAAKAAGSLPFCRDIRLPGMLYLKLILSPVAHGYVRSVDVSDAMAVPGVVRILTYEDAPDRLYSRGKGRITKNAPEQERIFNRHVRFVGDRIGAVLAETPSAALQAAFLVRMEIDSYPAFLTPRKAMEASGGIPIHETDSVIRLPAMGFGSYESAEGEEFVQKTSVERVSHIAMEPHCAVADYRPGTGEMTIYTPTQSVFGVRSAVCTLLDLPMSRVRVLKTPMGGSFGSKQEMILEPVAALASLLTGRPVQFCMTRREVMLCTVCRHPVESEIRAKFTGDGRLTGVRLLATLDAGAYQTVTPDYAASISKNLAWVYDYGHLEYLPVSVCTNTPVSGGYRGWGGPEAVFIMETMMNGAARAFGMDPVDLRLKNILPPHAVSRIGNFDLGSLPLKKALELGRIEFGWDARRQRTAAQDRSARCLHGVGMALSVHTSGYYPRKFDWAAVILKIEEDGSVSLNCGIHDHGCGQAAAMKKIAAEVLETDPGTVSVPEGDTAFNALDNGCYSSRTVYVVGKAVEEAAREMKARVLSHAARMFGVPESELIYAEGTVYVIGRPSESLTLSQIACDCADCGPGALLVSHTHVPKSNPGPVAAHFAEVSVDTHTGLVDVLDYLAVHDVGTAINPEICRGQVGSAVQQGIGAVFCEGLEISRSTGRARNADLQRYHVARAADMPRLTVRLMEDPDENGPFGAKSIGESAYLPAAPALLAAVNDALGSDLTSLPVTPAVILRTVRKES